MNRIDDNAYRGWRFRPPTVKFCIGCGAPIDEWTRHFPRGKCGPCYIADSKKAAADIPRTGEIKTTVDPVKENRDAPRPRKPSLDLRSRKKRDAK